VSPRGILDCDANHELPDRGCRGRPSRVPSACVVPLARDQSPVPGEQGRRGHREYLATPAAGDQLRQGREPQPVGGLVPDPADLAAQHCVLMPEPEKLGILGHLAPRQHRQAAEEAAREEVADREDHPAMIPARQAAQAKVVRTAWPGSTRTAWNGPSLIHSNRRSASSGPTRNQVLLVAACLKRGHIGPSGCRQVEPQQAVMVGPNGTVLARPDPATEHSKARSSNRAPQAPTAGPPTLRS
jgi:hypothetical protein